MIESIVGQLDCLTAKLMATRAMGPTEASKVTANEKLQCAAVSFRFIPVRHRTMPWQRVMSHQRSELLNAAESTCFVHFTKRALLFRYCLLFLSAMSQLSVRHFGPKRTLPSGATKFAFPP